MKNLVTFLRNFRPAIGRNYDVTTHFYRNKRNAHPDFSLRLKGNFKVDIVGMLFWATGIVFALKLLFRR